MKLCKTLLCLLLAAVLCMSTVICAGAAEQEPRYTTVFVHGLMGWGAEDGLNEDVPYWGMTSGTMLEALEQRGYETAVASVGPLSSCWDRCCELYAQLTGTRTDYGAAHAEEIDGDFQANGVTLTHNRYGRDYTGKAIVENWGPGIDNKINLVGHSFGGPTAVMFLHLLAEGDENERNYAKAQARELGGSWQDYCSPLFWGNYDGENLIHSITSLAGVLNGTSFIDSCSTSTQVLMRGVTMFANTLGDTAMNDLYDFQLEQFGLTSSPTTDYKYTLDLINAYRFLDGKDNAIYDLSIEGCNELKQGWKTYDNVFYFAYAGNCTHENAQGYHDPNANTWVLLTAFAAFMGRYTNENQVVTDTAGNPYCVVDEAWLSNDGLVNTVSSQFVFGHAHKDWDGTVEPGLWITMPLYGFDHMDFCGGLLEPTQNSRQTTAFFDEVINNIASTYTYVEPLATPTLQIASKRLLGKAYAQLTWNKVEGAEKYRIYKASYAGGSFRLLGTVTSASLKDYAVVRNRTYYYKIVAVKSGTTETVSPMSSVTSIRIK